MSPLKGSRPLKPGKTGTSGELKVSYNGRPGLDDDIISSWKYGYAEAFKKTPGPFALAVSDESSDVFYLAADRFSTVPLYYRITEKKLEYSTSPDDLTSSRQVDPGSVFLFLSLNFLPAPYTMFKDVRKLRPGEILIMEKGSPRRERYWTPFQRDLRFAGSAASAAGRIRELLLASVERAMKYDPSILLSGGVDSSIVTALAAKVAGKKVKTISLAFDEESYDESEFARAVSRRYGTEHRVVEFQPDFPGFLEEILYGLPEPLGDSSIAALTSLLRRLGSDVKCLVSGSGGDELFGGYDRYLAMRYLGRADRAFPGALSKLDRLKGGIRESSKTRDWRGRVNRLARAGGARGLDRYIALMGKPGWDKAFAMLNRMPVDGDIRRKEIHDSFELASGFSSDEREAAMRFDMETSLPWDGIYKDAISGLLYGMEVLFPFLDEELIDFALSISAGMKMEPRRTKALLIKSFRDILPSEITTRKKRGFAAPMGICFRRDLADWLGPVLSEKRIEATGLLEYEAVRGILDEHMSGKSMHTESIFSLLSLVFWMEKRRLLA